MAEEEPLQRSHLFEKVSGYPRTSSLTAMSFGLIASGLLFLKERRKKESVLHKRREKSHEWPKTIKHM
jgi:hypothetical protein